MSHAELHLTLYTPPTHNTCHMQQLIERDLPGYAIGGLAGGESKDDFWRMVAMCAAPDGEGGGRGR